MMELKNIGKRYGQQQVVDQVSLTITPGKLTAFIGPNGAGKSSLLSMMSRLLAKDEGAVLIKDKDIEAWPSSDLAKELTMLRQQLSYQTKFTVYELISFGRFPYSQGRLTEEDRQKIEEAIGYMELDAFRDRMIDTLSGGQLQRVFIAMVLAQDTETILLDEPLNNLDIKQSVAMMKTLRRLVQDLGKTIVIVIHDINMASQFADQIVAFKDGRVFAAGTPQEVMIKDVLDPLYEMDLYIDEINGKRICLFQ